jgi:hypothetical protein
MKTIASTVMLALLLYQMLGLPVALLGFENVEKIIACAEIDAVHEEHTVGPAGVASWQRFSELSEMILEIHADQQASQPAGQRLKLLDDLVKMYLPAASMKTKYGNECARIGPRASFADPTYVLISQISELQSPPPEGV